MDGLHKCIMLQLINAHLVYTFRCVHNVMYLQLTYPLQGD